jgi:hypothetical protein
MDRLDRFVEQALIPEYTKDKRRAKNPIDNQTSSRAHDCRLIGRVEEAKRLEQARRTIPANDPHDPDDRRLYYVRYADDFLLGFTGPRCEAEVVRDRLKTFLSQGADGKGRRRFPVTAIAIRAHELRHKPRTRQPPTQIPAAGGQLQRERPRGGDPAGDRGVHSRAGRRLHVRGAAEADHHR